MAWCIWAHLGDDIENALGLQLCQQPAARQLLPVRTLGVLRTAATTLVPWQVQGSKAVNDLRGTATQAHAGQLCPGANPQLGGALSCSELRSIDLESIEDDTYVPLIQRRAAPRCWPARNEYNSTCWDMDDTVKGATSQHRTADHCRPRCNEVTSHGPMPGHCRHLATRQ